MSKSDNLDTVMDNADKVLKLEEVKELVSITSLGPAWIVVFTTSHRGFLITHHTPIVS